MFERVARKRYMRCALRIAYIRDLNYFPMYEWVCVCVVYRRCNKSLKCDARLHWNFCTPPVKTRFVHHVIELFFIYTRIMAISLPVVISIRRKVQLTLLIPFKSKKIAKYCAKSSEWAWKIGFCDDWKMYVRNLEVTDCGVHSNSKNCISVRLC